MLSSQNHHRRAPFESAALFIEQNQGEIMSNLRDTRVLSRQAARELSQEEIECVNGALRLSVCSFNPITCQLDGPFPCKPPAPACGS
jgi:hypothetical protein